MRVSIVALLGVGLSAQLFLPGAARGQSEARGAGVEVDCAIDCTVTGLALVGTFALQFVPVDTDERWGSELFGALDRGVRDNFSISAAHASDGLLGATVFAPVLLTLERGLDADAARRGLVYSETIAVSLLVNNLAKYVVQRPRPYSYNADPRVRAFAEEQGKGSHLSFYSGHASIAFSAAVSGSYLYAVGSDDVNSKALVWLLEMSLAAAVANLRVRAGKHFYSDVFVGAVIGGAIGYLVPALRADERGPYAPSALEWGAIAGGLILGTLASQLWPLEDDIAVPVDEAPSEAPSPGGVQIAPRLGFSASF